MNIHNPNDHRTLTTDLQALLQDWQTCNPFDPVVYVQQKADKLNRYMHASNLKACVVAVSGGVDSALVLGIVHYASHIAGSPIEQIVPVLLPVFDRHAATNQDVATQRGLELCTALGLQPCLIDLTSAHQTTKTIVDSALNVQGEGWASGQLVAYQRTPALYYVTSLLSQQGRPAILVGTTNFDEGAYLGYFGKASDGLVDIQLISDIHKSEVFTCAQLLGTPESILLAVPTGDMYDGRIDEEVFGASYAGVELFLRGKMAPDLLQTSLAALPADSVARFTELSRRLEELHRYNHHKYLGKSPAVHLDVITRRIQNGWDYYVYPE